MKYLFALLFLGQGVLLAQPKMGLVWEDERYAKLPLKSSYGRRTQGLAAVITMRNYCPRVINQSFANTAVAWSAVWYGRTILEAQDCGWQDVATVTDNAFAPMFSHHRITKKASSCEDPISVIDLLESLRTEGTLRFKELQDPCPDSVPNKLLIRALPNRNLGFLRLFNVFDSRDEKVNAVKEALAARHPVIAGIIAPPSFAAAREFWQVREKPEPGKTGHSLCIVGFDDNKFGGAFEIVNNSGKGWGVEGFSWLRYDDMKDFVRYGFELLPGAVGPCATRDVTGAIGVQLFSGDSVQVQMLSPGKFRALNSFKTGDTFQFRMSSGIPQFFYVIGIDEQGNNGLYFPSKGDVPWIWKSGEIFPLFLSDPPGKNLLLFIISQHEMDVSKLLPNLKKQESAFQQALLWSKAAEAQKGIAFSTQKMEWTGKAMSVAPMVIALEIDQK